MRKRGMGILAAALAALPACASAQTPPLSESISISSGSAFTWSDDSASIAQFEGPVLIELDNVKMSAGSAVVWITPAPGIVPDTQLVEIALVGDAQLVQGSAKRTGDRLFVTARVRQAIKVSADQRLTRPRTSSDLFQLAQQMREQGGLAAKDNAGRWRMPRPSPFVERPEHVPSGTPAQAVEKELTLRVERGYTITQPDGRIAMVIDKGLRVTIRTRPDQLTELKAARGVVFTNARSLTENADVGSGAGLADQVEAIYLEGDVQVLYSAKSASRPDSRLEADRVYYEVATDRAVLTNAIVHTMDPSNQIPIIMRASLIKQLSRDEDHAEYRLIDAKLTTSSFATPSYSIGADRVYVKQTETGDWYGMRTAFSSQNATLDFWDVPVFWLPYSAGTLTEHGFPLRSAEIGSSNKFGFFTRSEWGLFETIGRAPPRDLDLSFRADYLGQRGPATGINGDYRGSSVSGTTRQPSSFEGGLESYFVNDHGEDDFGGDRRKVQPDNDMRGRLRWQHQAFLPDNWQVQLRSGWVSDPTFIEEYFPNEYRTTEPQDTSIYIKHQRDSEAVTLLVQGQPNKVVTSQEFAQENLEVERLPELSYHLIGESFGNDNFTLYSDNSISRLHFQRNDASLDELGYPANTPDHPFTRGIPVEGSTGTTGDYVSRGDFRQEVAFPVTIDRFRVQPYALARYTPYSDSPTGDNPQRTLVGGGVRMTTAFWKVDDHIESDLWDIHRMRHVVEPELHLFGSVSDTDRQDVFVYDQQVDQPNDITAAQFALRQKWQTKRGGPGQWQSVDFFTWNLDATFYGNKPDDRFLQPTGFRGMFFASEPETSIPRDAVNSDQAWRVNESTVVMADQQYNLDESQMATSSIGMAVRRGSRVTYYIGDRYINELDSNIATILAAYEISTRYSISILHSYDFGDQGRVRSAITTTRRFDRFSVALTLSVDETTGDSGVFLAIRPNYAREGVSSSALPGGFGTGQ